MVQFLCRMMLNLTCLMLHTQVCLTTTFTGRSGGTLAQGRFPGQFLAPPPRGHRRNQRLVYLKGTGWDGRIPTTSKNPIGTPARHWSLGQFPGPFAEELVGRSRGCCGCAWDRLGVGCAKGWGGRVTGWCGFSPMNAQVLDWIKDWP